MTLHDEHGTDEQLDAISARLEAERPVPAAAFRGELRRRLLTSRAESKPGRIRVLVAAYGGSGLLLLVVAGIGLAGAGPFAA